MKKISIIFSFLIITVFSTGSYFLYKCYLNAYKNEFKLFIVEHKVPTNSITININPSELYVDTKTILWEDENKEVIYEGKLYDIVCVKTNGVKVELTTVSDEQEMELKKQFSLLFDTNSNKTTKGPINLLKSFFALKYISNNTLSDFRTIVLVKTNKYIVDDYKILQGFNSLTTPPPNLSI